MISAFLSLLNIRTEEDSYTVLERQGPFELRLYKRRRLAKVLVEGGRREAYEKGVSLINDYLSGNNFRVQKVVSYGPSFQIDRGGSWEVGVILPDDLSLLEIPKPINHLIKIEESIPVKAGALRFKAAAEDDIINRRARELKKWMKLKGYRPSETVSTIHHDFALELPFLRNSEVLIDCQQF